MNWRADVAGHDDDRVLEIDGAALAVGDAAVVEDLEQDVEDVVVRFFDFVEEHDGIGLAADGLAELAAFLVADVAGRRADEPGDAVLLHVFAHVDADHGVLVVEEEFGERVGEFGFADAGGAEEDEGTDGAVFVLQAGAGAAHGVGDGGDGLLLADDALAEALFHGDELFAFAFLEAGSRECRSSAIRPGDVLLGDFLLEQDAPCASRASLSLCGFELRVGARGGRRMDLAGAREIADALGAFEVDLECSICSCELARTWSMTFFSFCHWALRPADFSRRCRRALSRSFRGAPCSPRPFPFQGLPLHFELHDLALELRRSRWASSRVRSSGARRLRRRDRRPCRAGSGR